MSRRVFGFILAIVAFGATALQATSGDPQGILDKAIAGIPSTPVDAFSLGADASGGGAFNFQNVSGQDWIALDFFVILPQGSTISTETNPFFGGFHVTSTNLSVGGTCDGLIATSTDTACYDFGFDRPINGGIPNLQIFGLNLNDLIDGRQNFDPNGAGGWGPGNDMNGLETDAVPEPASWLLLGSGIVLMGFFLRLRRRSGSSVSLF